MARLLLAALAAATLQVETKAPTPEPLADVSGRYYAGDGLSSNVTLVIDRQAYEMTTSADVPGSERRIAGRVSRDGTRLLLTADKQWRVLFDGTRFHLTPDKQSSSEESRSLAIARWGPRLYLVDSDQLKWFCLSAAKGPEPRERPFGQWLLRIGHESKPVPKGSRPDVCR